LFSSSARPVAVTIPMQVSVVFERMRFESVCVYAT
jgi:hypothetical protein